MAYGNISITREDGFRFGAVIRSLAETLGRRVEWRTSYRQTLNELRDLNDRELADIGIARSNIRRVAREHADLTVPLHDDRRGR